MVGLSKLAALSSAAVVTLSALAVAPGSVEAQLGGEGFTFRPPTVSLAFHGGYAVPTARSDLFDATIDDLFLDRNDFRSPYLGGELSVRATDRLDVSLEVGHAWSSTLTEWRDYVESNDQPIWQTVRYSRTPVTVSGKFYVTDRGRRIGQLVWIPEKVMPYVGVGAGVVRYAFARDGDHVVEETLEIFTDNLEQVGTAFTAHGYLGVDVHVSKMAYLTPQLRYTWAEGGLDRTVYQGFQPMDLSGFQLSLGLGMRF